MAKTVDTVAAAIAAKPHSFDQIRGATGLSLTDDQFVTLINGSKERFKMVHFVKRDDEGKPILPGRPGVRLRAKPV